MKPIRAILSLAAVLLACTDATGNDPGTTGGSRFASLRVTALGGDNQTGLAGRSLPQPLRVRVMFDSMPVPDAVVAWATSAGSLAISASVTDAEGVASADWVLGEVPGPMTATVTVDGAAGSPLEFHASALSVITASLVSGDNQSGTVGQPLGQQLVVKILGSGVPEAGVLVTWTSSDGSIPPTSVATDGRGLATFSWTLGPVAGEVLGYATVARSEDPPITFHANAEPGPATQLAIGGGDNQAVPANQPQSGYLWVVSTDQYGNPNTQGIVDWSVQSGPVNVFGQGGMARAQPIGEIGTAVVRAVLRGTGAYVDFTVTIGPPIPLVILDVDDQYDRRFVSWANGSSPAVDTLPVGGTMTWLLSYDPLQDHAISSVGEPSFAGGHFGYGGDVHGVAATFTSPGVYLYEDPYSPGSSGTVVVQ
ncbi:MAG: hypothetical protein Q8W45_05110 [Candidatus Palauibacterales bacterium]|nr:hypothetical protein [Candidatus Palauibacterales bacterium]